MMNISNIQSALVYVADLVQRPDGYRFVSVRLSTDAPHEDMVLHTNPSRGDVMREFVLDPKFNPDFATSEGILFGIDAHGVWLTVDETIFLHNCAMNESLNEEKGPWVNGLRPIFAPK